ncbi:hypothetical protein N0V94_001905 [Neodidymelliopsis sp. IMI 364377]|nr:hypothetical protein N0V94_001905 [Neodidymelliopsis sp. IMI 364377]
MALDMHQEPSTAKAHADRVKAISRTVREFYEQNIPFRIFHGSSNSTRAAARQQIVDISSLNHVLHIDRVKKTALVEPGIAMDKLVKELIPHNLMPAVVPEFPGITAGGAFAGTAAESSSFRYGYFDSAVNEIEIVLGNGDIVLASPTQSSDLFYGSAGAMGTLGITTQLEIQLVACKPYVEVTYHLITSQTEALARFEKVPSDIDFTDGIMFSPAHGAIIEAKFTDRQPNTTTTPLTRFTRAHDPWFFTHVHAKLRCPPHLDTPSTPHFCMTCHWTQNSYVYAQNNHTLTELVPFQDYLFRYERGVFWMACYGWAPTLWNRATRYLFDAVWHTRFQYRVLHLTGGAPHIIQDVAIPGQRADEFLRFMKEEMKVYPLWLCPIRQDPRALLHTAVTDEGPTEFLVNVGVWGSPNYGLDYLTAETFERFVTYNRKLERKVAEVGGLKWLYATNYYREEEFWAMYDKKRYDGLRGRWKADRLPDLWAKVKRSQQDVKEVPVSKVLKAIVYAGLGIDRLVT